MPHPPQLDPTRHPTPAPRAAPGSTPRDVSLNRSILRAMSTRMEGLFVSDLDGTLADRNARLSPFTRRQLRQLLRSGLPFTIASARSIHTLSPILEGLPLTLPVAELNGAFITDWKTRATLLCRALDSRVAEAVVRSALALGVPPFVCAHVEGQQRLYPPVRLTNAGMAWYDESRRRARDPRLREAVDPLTLLDHGLVCLTLIARHAMLAPLARAIERDFPAETHCLLYENRYQPGWHWLTVQAEHANKAHALRWIAEANGTRLEHTTVFGDEINDVPMFRIAGRAVAVDNAIGELKLLAHEVIGSHDDDSVVKYLLRDRA
jgi:5-amino-6-(5-phospho-D-ribitylamino)uracil phosphatase